MGGGSDEAPVLPVSVAYELNDMLLSAALAHGARLAAAGLDAEEVRDSAGWNDQRAAGEGSSTHATPRRSPSA